MNMLYQHAKYMYPDSMMVFKYKTYIAVGKENRERSWKSSKNQHNKHHIKANGRKQMKIISKDARVCRLAG